MFGSDYEELRGASDERLSLSRSFKDTDLVSRLINLSYAVLLDFNIGDEHHGGASNIRDFS